MDKRKFFSERQSGKERSYGLDELKKLFKYEVEELEHLGYLDQYFGGESNDGVGWLGSDPSIRVYACLRKKGLWPLGDMSSYSSEGDVFDMIEYLFEHVSIPSYEFGGWCYDDVYGKKIYLSNINGILRGYEGGFELSEGGDVVSLVPDGLELLFDADISHPDKENVEKRVCAAKLSFRMRDKEVGSFQNRKNAVRELADVLEFLRAGAREVIKREDENNLFNIANNFGIRHHNAYQKTDYDEGVFLDWIFYYYLASIHACVHLLKRKGVF